MEFRNPSNGVETLESEVSSNCSTPYVSAPSSPTRNPNPSFFFSAPPSPTHFILSPSTTAATAAATSSDTLYSVTSFEFDGRHLSNSMISADEIFLNGQIRPQILLEDDVTNPRGRDIKLRSGSIHRRARSMSPIRKDPKEEEEEEEETMTSAPASSSSSRNSKRWVFLKDLLYRSKSEGSGTRSNRKEKEKDKFWHFSRSNNKENTGGGKTALKSGNNGVGKGMAAAHARHYNANRAQAEEMRRRTSLPYRQGTLFGCLGFSSRSYGAVSGFVRTVNPVSSR